MTNEDAMIIIGKLLEDRCYSSDIFRGAQKMAMIALINMDEYKILKEKQEPKKPIVEQYKTFYRCPVCDRYVNIGSRKFEYCPNCGQAIDWGSEND